jgi:exopolysaccharide production protein ExoZ
MPIAVDLLGMRTWPEKYRVLLLCLTASTYAVMAGMGYVSHIRMLMFVAGMLLSEAIGLRYLNFRLGAAGEVVAIGLFVPTLHFVALVKLHPSELTFLPGSPNWLPVYRTLSLAVTGSAVALYAFSFDRLLNRAFSQAPLRWLGNMSYSYYLIHGRALHAFATCLARVFPQDTRSALSFWLLLPAALLVTFGTSDALFLLVEKPLSLVSKTMASAKPLALPLAGESEAPVSIVNHDPVNVDFYKRTPSRQAGHASVA